MIKKRKIVFNKFLKFLIKDGKKIIAYKILHKSLTLLKDNLNSKQSIYVLLNQIIYNVSPDIEIKTKKIGTNNYLIPKPLSEDQKLNFGIRNILEATKSRKEYTMKDRLAAELLDAYNLKGIAIKKKEETHRLAEANKSFAHFNW